METAHIGGEPRNTGHAHVDGAGNLGTKVGEGRTNVSRPNKRTIALRTSPSATGEVDDVTIPSYGLLPLVESFVIVSWVDVCHLLVWAGVISIVVEIVRSVFRFRFIEPECINPKLGIICSALLPNIFASFWIGGVIELAGTFEHHADVFTLICAHEKVL